VTSAAAFEEVSSVCEDVGSCVGTGLRRGRVVRCNSCDVVRGVVDAVGDFAPGRPAGRTGERLLAIALCLTPAGGPAEPKLRQTEVSGEFAPTEPDGLPVLTPITRKCDGIARELARADAAEALTNKQAG
jgi:hypothetical protein